MSTIQFKSNHRELLNCRRSIRIFVMALLLVGAGSLQIFAAAEETLQDKAITIAIETKFDHDKLIDSRLIDVETTNGIVTLSGSARSLFEKERAVELSQIVKGVQSIVDRLEVLSEQRSDDELEKDIKSALFADTAADSYEIDININNGKVTMSGTVNSWAEKELARQVVRDIAGIKKDY